MAAAAVARAEVTPGTTDERAATDAAAGFGASAVATTGVVRVRACGTPARAVAAAKVARAEVTPGTTAERAGTDAAAGFGASAVSTTGVVRVRACRTPARSARSCRGADALTCGARVCD